MNPTPQHIAIVGAGLSGLSCAQALIAAGHTVHLFEKSRGASGRMSTRRGDDAGQPWQCDHGAQYFTASDPAFRAEVARWEAAGAAAPWNVPIASFDGSHWGTPATPTERFVGTPRMTSPAISMMQDLDAKLHLHLQTTVQQVQRVPEGWMLTSTEHGQHSTRYDALLLAVPAPQVLPETWLLHATPEWSEAHIEDDAAVVTAALLDAFAALGGPAPDAAIATSAHRWRYADTESALSLGSWWDAHAQLGLCGDWLNGGKVEGAWLSGRALAQQVLAGA